MDATGTIPLERPNLWMDRLYHNSRVVKATPIKVDHLCCEPYLLGPNIAVGRYVASCPVKGIPCRLSLPWAIGINAIVA
jgi:hypothetical protein